MPNRKPAYLTKEVAAKRSGRSVRRLLELASAGRIRKQIVKDEENAGRALALFHPADIDALARGENPPPPAALQISGPMRPPAALPQGEEIAKTPRLWLTIAEAAEYSGLPASFLTNRVAAGALPAIDVGVRPGGRWRIARRDLRAFSAPDMKDLRDRAQRNGVTLKKS
jgi:excisionase family DNA binding protein